MKFLKAVLMLLIVIAIFVLVVAFLSANAEISTLDLLFIPPVSAKLGVMVVFSFVVGGLLGLLTASMIVIRQKRAKSVLEKRLRDSTRLMSNLGS